jgi:hypothetical protein
MEEKKKDRGRSFWQSLAGSILVFLAKKRGAWGQDAQAPRHNGLNSHLDISLMVAMRTFRVNLGL